MRRVILMLFITVSIGLNSCNNAKQTNTDSEMTVPPTNGDETRYNINPTDTLVTPVDSNSTDTTMNNKTP